MADRSRNVGRRGPSRKNTFVTHSGNSIKINRSFGDRFKAYSASRARRRANRLSTLPKGHVKRMIYRLQPKRLVQYWFSRDGLIMALKITGISIVVIFVMLIGLFAYFRKDLPKLNDISGGNLGGSISYYDRTGTILLWQDYNAVKRAPVPSNQISNYMKQATVAIEDKNFYHEGAFSLTGIARAGIHDFIGGSSGGLQGASTITEQVVKLNENWVGNRTITTKIKEVILAVDLSREYSKDTILTGYLNVAPYGGVDYGVEAAARDYFNEDASQLTLSQAAMLAAIPQSPSYYSPYSDPKYNSAASSNEFGEQALLDRKNYILDLMAKQHYITQDQATQAKKVDVLSQVQPLANKYAGIKAPYFVLAAKQELENRFGAATVQRGGWRVTTTLNMSFQTQAEQIIAANYRNASTHGADEEATVAEDVKTGQIVALVGGVDFNNPDHGQNNYASGIEIPPGSSFKPYDYTTLINNNNHVGAGSVIYDSEGPIPGYPCTIKGSPPPTGQSNCLADYDFLQPGPITLRYALGGSRNIPAVKAMTMAVPNDTSPDRVNSVNKVISTASAMMDNPYEKSTYNCYSDTALTQTTQCYDSSAIGDGAFLHLDDHVNGLSTLARLGVAIPRTYILKIDDSDGKNIYQFTQPKGTQVVKPDSAYIVDNMASDPNASYLPGSCTATTCSTLAHGGYKFQRDNGWTFAVKTGTTNNGFDGLMTSWSPDYAVVSWVGNHTRNVALSTFMEILTEPITRPMMEMLHKGVAPVAWTQPSDIKVLPAFVVRNHIHNGDIEPSPSTDLFPSWYVSGTSSQATSGDVDKISNLQATNCTPPLAKQTVTNANVSSWNIDIYNGGMQSIGATAVSTGTSSTGANTDNVHSCNDPALAAPTISIDDASGNAIVPDGSGNYECTGACMVIVALSAPPPDTTQGSAPYARYPVNVNLQANGQTASTQSVGSADGFTTLTFSYTPSSTPTPISVQLVDNALYSAQSSSYTVVAAANNGNQGQGQGNGH